MKTILLSNGQALKLTFEETRKQFLPMIKKTIKQTNSKFVFNIIDEEDFSQELEIELWRAYEDYDFNYGTCFSTYLYYKLKKGVRNVTYSRYTLKNKNNGISSIDAPIDNKDLKLIDILPTIDYSLNNLVSNELIEIILENTPPKDRDALQVILDRETFSVSKYATKHQISRQAANQRIVKLRKQLQKVISEKYLHSN
ncbi:sigma-70 family RNA polymerase sigma factor [Bacillus atrophaeus]|uniref:sigma-70 family RNA polymerase sigma factor n=1 Tax=Bacillus atrophaeus TaxID=1452 RepID=UPI0022801590|nr:sigma-70 family RNA polymerase sigma factor [Bacillus atrophaeus]MCY8857450.1 sigma-70 family RNA polymerase sigma factor [Bacillus atrophaeus]MED1121270.1 sigma-70 family RNA polymerase sigma factor [Bacillus atrophaeus]